MQVEMTQFAEYFVDDYLILYSAETGEYHSSVYMPIEYIH